MKQSVDYNYSTGQFSISVIDTVAYPTYSNWFQR